MPMTDTARFLSNLTDKLETEFKQSQESELFMYYRMSTETAYGDALIGRDAPEGYQLADGQVFRSGLPYARFRVIVRGIMATLPILPYGR